MSNFYLSLESLEFIKQMIISQKIASNLNLRKHGDYKRWNSVTRITRISQMNN